MSGSTQRWLAPLAVGLMLAGPLAPAAIAQEGQAEAIPGVTLGLVYETQYIPPIAILPFEGPGAETVVSQVRAIISRDLRYSDRFSVIDSLPAAFAGTGVDYGLWDQFGADWVLTGALKPSGDAFTLDLALHSVVFAAVEERLTLAVPAPTSESFRMAVHRGSDRIVEAVFGEPGMAATRIVFTMNPPGDEPVKEIYSVDSDGENLRRLTWEGNTVASPAWSPDGGRVAYTSWKSGRPTIYERTLATDTERALEANREGQQITPAYHPDGEQIAFALLGGGRSGLYSFNLEQECCLATLSGGRYEDLQPTYSPDGRRLAFVSNRLGTRTPQVYVMPSAGGDAELLSPYRFGEGGYFTDPDWSPVAGKVAFAGRIQGRQTRYHILVADVETGDSRLVQLTREGDNQDPSWAPDGRHIVFTGARSWGRGIFIVDSGTGNLRTLLSGVRAEDTDWSPLLGDGSDSREAEGVRDRR